MFFLNERRNDDKKRTFNFCKLLKENPLKYHKRKYNLSLSDINNGNNNIYQNNNSELLFCQKENDKIIKSFHNFMKSRSQILDKNKRNYLNFLAKEKERKNNKYIININQTQNLKKYKPLNNCLSLSNDNNYTNDVNINSYSFSPKYRKNVGSDVTNPNYFDNIAKKLIMQKNMEILNYNNNAYKSKYNPNIIYRNNFSLRKNLPLPPGKINSPRFYFLGESKLDRNPIVNPGNRCSSPVYNNFNKRKSEFT